MRHIHFKTSLHVWVKHAGTECMRPASSISASRHTAGGCSHKSPGQPKFMKSAFQTVRGRTWGTLSAVGKVKEPLADLRQDAWRVQLRRTRGKICYSCTADATEHRYHALAGQ